MSDLHMNFGLQPHDRPDNDEAREARHQVLATLLGAYADGELPPETVSQIDAHLLGCAPCRREVELHNVVRARLSHEPLLSASPALRERIVDEVGRVRAQASAQATTTLRPWWQTSRALMTGGVAIIAVATGIAATRIMRAGTTSRAAVVTVNANTVPLFADVLDDYRRVTTSDLPGRARDLDAVRAAVPFPVQPLHAAGASLLAAWSTDLRGEPAAVLAYRWHDRLVLEYLVAEPVFFRHPGVRAPIAAGATITANAGAQGMVAWAAPESGAFLIGDVTPTELMALRVSGAGR
jgi:anti-sigma factor RsiW